MPEDHILEGGALLTPQTVSITDYILGTDNLQSMITSGFVKPDNVQHYYNQAAQRRTRNGCTLYMAMGLISDLTGHRFTIEEILEIHDSAEKNYGWVESEGGYLWRAIDCVRNWWNAKYTDKQLISFRFKLTSKEAKELIARGKSIGIGYRTTVKHYKDSQDNGRLDSPSFKGETINGGHAIRAGLLNSKFNNIDNYEGVKKYNVYLNEHLDNYVKEKTYFNEGYVFFYKDEGEFKDVPKNSPHYEIVKWAVDLGLINGFEDGTFRPNDPITRVDLLRILRRASKIEQ